MDDPVDYIFEFAVTRALNWYKNLIWGWNLGKKCPWEKGVYIRAAFSDGFEGKSWYVLKINKETKVSFNKMLSIIDKYY